MSSTCWQIAAVRPAVVGTPTSWTTADSARGWSGWPARRPGNSQRESRLVAVRMLVCRPRYSSSSAATGAGIGDGGSPSRSRIWSWVADDVVDGEPGDPADRLAVEQQDHSGGPAAQRGALVGEDLAEQHCGRARAAARRQDLGRSDRPGPPAAEHWLARNSRHNLSSAHQPSSRGRSRPVASSIGSTNPGACRWCISAA
jgi:hypothetical protein